MEPIIKVDNVSMCFNLSKEVFLQALMLFLGEVEA